MTIENQMYKNLMRCKKCSAHITRNDEGMCGMCHIAKLKKEHGEMLKMLKKLQENFIKNEEKTMHEIVTTQIECRDLIQRVEGE